MKILSLIAKPFEKHILSWMAKRARIDTKITLTQRCIYIFLSTEGALYGALLLITFITGVNYANNLILGLCFYLGSVLVVCIHYTYAQLSGLQIQLLDISDTEVSDRVRVRLQLQASGSKAHKQLQVSFVLDDVITMDEMSNDDNEYVLQHHLSRLLEPQTITFYLPALERGRFELPRLKVRSVYPLGILQTWTYVMFSKTAWIWPKQRVFSQYGQDMSLASSDSSLLGQRKGQDDFDMLDTYKEGESLARVSWRHVASGRGMLTKHFADPVGKDIVLDYANMPSTNHEQKLSQLSYAVQQLSQSSVPFSLKLPHTQLELNSGALHEKQALILLAQAPKYSSQSVLQSSTDIHQEAIS